MDSRFHQRLNILSGVDAAFTDHDPIPGNRWDEIQRYPQVRGKCPQVPVVNSNDLGACGKGFIQLFPGVNLDEG